MSTERRNPQVESIAAALHARHCPCDVWPCAWQADPNDPTDTPAADLVEGWRSDAKAVLTAALAGVPEPIGYAVVTDSGAFVEGRYATLADARRDADEWSASYPLHPKMAVCALIPVEDTP